MVFSANIPVLDKALLYLFNMVMRIRLVHMRLSRKYILGVLFFTSFAICLLLPLPVSYSKNSLAGNLRPNRIVPPSSEGPLVFIDRTVDSTFERKSDKGAHSGFNIFLLKLRMILEEDCISKIILLNNAVKFVGCHFFSCSQFRFILPVLTPSQGFRFSFSGLSPPV